MRSQGISEYRDLQNLAYLLDKPGLFSSTGYKVMQTQEKNGFIRCARIQYNGRDKLLYNIEPYKNLEILLPAINVSTFVTIVRNLLSVVLEAYNNGFMSCDNIDISLQKIFIEADTYKVYLIYLPIDLTVERENRVPFENELRKCVLEALENNYTLMGEETEMLSNALKNPVYTLGDIYNIANELHCTATKNEKQPVIALGEQMGAQSNMYSVPVQQPAPKKKGLFARKKKETQPKGNQVKTPSFHQVVEGGATQILEQGFTPNICLVGIKTSVTTHITVTKPEFLIGKSKETVDGAITYNNAISRVHCKIVYREGKNYIMDMGSSNGTFVNGMRLVANELRLIHVGDNIRIANTNLIIKAV